MKLTLCAIMKDVETALPAMVESAKDIVDEIVLCDTGSADNTIEVAKQYTDKVLVHPKAKRWSKKIETFDFAEARNWALDQCTGDWVLVLDTDEQLDPKCKDEVRRCIEQMPDNMGLLLVQMVMCRDDGTVYQEFLAERLMRKGCRFQNAMHNWVEAPEGMERAEASFIRILHNRVHMSEEARSKRAIQRLSMAEHVFLKKLADEPNDRRSMFYLAGTYHDAGRIDDAISWFEKYLEISDWPEERYQAAILLATDYLIKGESEKARRVVSANMIDNWRRGEGLLMLADIAMDKGDLSQAEWWAKVATLKEKPIDPLFVEHDAHTWRPHEILWRVYQKMQDNEKAQRHGREAIEQGCPTAAQILHWEKNHIRYEDQKIAVLVDRGQMDFIQPVIDHWRRQGKVVEVTSDSQEVEKLAEWADIVWCEWAGNLAAAVTNIDKKGKIIVRIHGYELHSGLLEKVNWGPVDDVIFVSRSLMESAIAAHPVIAAACNIYYVHGGVDVEEFTISKDRTGKKIAMLGYVNKRKNIPLALQILAKLPDHELHIAGEWQDGELFEYVKHLADNMGLVKRLFIYGRVEDKAEWLKDKDYILSTSIRETFHYAVAEGMAAGLKPVVHDWESASHFYPQEFIFGSVDEAVEIIRGESRAEDYRGYVKENLGLDRELWRIDRILKRPVVAVCGEPKFQYAAEYKLMRSLENLGCKTDAPNPDVVLMMGPTPKLEPWMESCFKVLWVDDKVGDSERDIKGAEWRAEAVKAVDLVVVQNPHWIEPLKAEGAKRVEYVPIFTGACPPFRKLSCEKEFDVGFYGYQTEHRDPKLEELGNRFGVHFMHNLDHNVVNDFINRCKLIVNLHAYPDNHIEWRIGEAMSAGACVVSERLPEGHPYPADCFVETDDVAGAIDELLDDDERREAIAKRGHEWIWSRFRLEDQMEKLLGLCAKSTGVTHGRHRRRDVIAAA